MYQFNIYVTLDFLFSLITQMVIEQVTDVDVFVWLMYSIISG